VLKLVGLIILGRDEEFHTHILSLSRIRSLIPFKKTQNQRTLYVGDFCSEVGGEWENGSMITHPRPLFPPEGSEGGYLMCPSDFNIPAEHRVPISAWVRREKQLNRGPYIQYPLTRG
jgi:hypothetical protein|tara:strand:- start:624 stop:974 length:351 start_codon:yes stop_codon:yes gene_type:complete